MQGSEAGQGLRKQIRVEKCTAYWLSYTHKYKWPVIHRALIDSCAPDPVTPDRYRPRWLGYSVKCSGWTRPSRAQRHFRMKAHLLFFWMIKKRKGEGGEGSWFTALMRLSLQPVVLCEARYDLSLCSGALPPHFSHSCNYVNAWSTHWLPASAWAWLDVALLH